MELIKVAEITEDATGALLNRKDYVFEIKGQGNVRTEEQGGSTRINEEFGMYDYLDIPTFIRRGVSLSCS